MNSISVESNQRIIIASYQQTIGIPALRKKTRTASGSFGFWNNDENKDYETLRDSLIISPTATISISEKKVVK